MIDILLTLLWLLLMRFLLVNILFDCWKLDLRGKLQRRARFEDCDANERLTDWRLRNPGVYIGLSPEGRKLVLKRIQTYKRYIAVHEFEEDQKVLDFLYSLLNDFPKPPPKRSPLAKLPQKLRQFLITLRLGLRNKLTTYTVL